MAAKRSRLQHKFEQETQKQFLKVNKLLKDPDFWAEILSFFGNFK